MWSIESCRVACLGISCVGEACMVVACLGVHTLGPLAWPVRVLGDPSIIVRDGVAVACLGIAAQGLAWQDALFGSAMAWWLWSVRAWSLCVGLLKSNLQLFRQLRSTSISSLFFVNFSMHRAIFFAKSKENNVLMFYLTFTWRGQFFNFGCPRAQMHHIFIAMRSILTFRNIFQILWARVTGIGKPSKPSDLP